MQNILGLSHIVFTTKAESIPKTSFLGSLYNAPEQYSFNHQSIRKELVRGAVSDTQLSLHSSIKGNLPALEIVQSNSKIKRPLHEYGLIFTPETLIEQPTTSLSNTINICDVITIKKTIFIPEIDSLAISSSELIKNNCDMGAWLVVNNLSSVKQLYETQLNAEIITSNQNYFIAKTKVVNKMFSSFMWVIMQDANKQNSFYNDDIGLSTLGWIGKTINNNIINGFKNTKQFSITMNNRAFNAKFYYNNDFPSLEVLTLNRPT